ncbi:BTB/POZ domain-containing protein NPY2-like [Iris pallida]|uniref:BTB/POZ domain-containing protein NPY2-like n=1 Tax=Iris pallida TaxID=29817 RepID=A0AAX6GW73_IRIPA|nr:BTB/POZ domain-containing protein NPY2-like [Iris pallida]
MKLTTSSTFLTSLWCGCPPDMHKIVLWHDGYPQCLQCNQSSMRSKVF